MKVYGPKELLEDVFQKALCVGCGACMEICPYIGSHKGKTAVLFPCDLARGRCYAHCPKAEVDLDFLSQRWWGRAYEGNPLGHHLLVLKARAGEKAPAGLFQAGGTVSSLIAFALHRRLLDAAVLTDREALVPLPRIVTRMGEVASCATSKYTAAPTLSAFNRALREGYEKIGVVGTPCQATALAQIRSNPTDRPEFKDPAALSIGLFCTWAVETRDLLRRLSTQPDLRKIRKMDIPPPPAEILVIETDEERVEISLAEIRPMVPRGCSVCPDMTAEWADLSVGVLEGNSRWNTLIIRTELGKELVERASQDGWLLTGQIPEKDLEHLRFAAANKKKRAFAAAMQEGLVNSDGRSCLRVNASALKKMLEGMENR